jgi:hypothetical protein
MNCFECEDLPKLEDLPVLLIQVFWKHFLHIFPGTGGREEVKCYAQGDDLLPIHG